jgi:Uma2 family endonuclease
MTQSFTSSPIEDSLDELWSDEPPLESDFHRDQIDLLVRLMRWVFSPGGLGGRNDVYVAGNLTVYYSPNQKKSEFFRGPDVFVVLGTNPRRRRSWTVWRENNTFPNLIIELLSDSTAEVDRIEKKEIYQSVWRVPEYFWFDPMGTEFQGFRLNAGQYQAIAPNAQGWLWSQELGFYLGVHDEQLRLFHANGQIVPLPEEAATERADQAESQLQQAETQLQQAETQLQQERQKAQALAERLRSLGIDPDA